MQRMVTAVLVLTMSAALAGCVATQEAMVNPKTGIPANCEAAGFGLIGVPLAMAMQAECMAKAKKAGMVPLAEYQATGGKVVSPGGVESSLIIDTDPPGAEIYAGTAEDQTRVRIGTTPYKLTNLRSSAWAEECYRTVLDGYKGQTQCHKTVVGDRKVFFKLEKDGQVAYK